MIEILIYRPLNFSEMVTECGLQSVLTKIKWINKSQDIENIQKGKEAGLFTF